MYIRSVIYEPGGRAREFAHLAVNLYAGCTGGCTYCYLPSILHITREQFAKCRPRPGVLKSLEKYAPKYAHTDKRLLLCFACDPYPKCEKGLAGKALAILSDNNVPFQVLTKMGSAAIQDFNLYGPNDAFASTLTFTNKEDSVKYEPNAAIPEERRYVLKIAKERGIHTWVSLEPVIDTAQTLELIAWTHEFVDLYKIGKLNYTKTRINWRRFAIEVVNLLSGLGKKYFIKEDLAKYLNDGEYENTDNRTVERTK